MKLIKKVIKEQCKVCRGKKCPVCNNTGKWEETMFYHIITDKKGRQYAFDGDTAK